MTKPWRRARLLCFHAAGLLIACGLKLFYSRAGADDLGWILAPTSRLAGLLGGIPFEREAGAGWISHSHRMIVGAGCAGINFLIIAFATLYFSFVHRFDRSAARAVWIAASAGAAYLLAVATNALRLVAAVHLHEMDIYSGSITPERVHRAEGTVVYCLALLLAYLTVERLLESHAAARRRRGGALSALVPISWYLAIALGVPLLARAWRDGPARFVEHAVVVISIGLFLGLAAVMLRAARLDPFAPGLAGDRILPTPHPRGRLKRREVQDTDR